MALLHVTKQITGIELIVAHFDHGIRPDSELDRKLVQAKSQDYHLLFEFAEGKLGSNASEATARQARYTFLKEVKAKHGAKAIITAHHQDDVLETAILNMSRGTGWRGLVSLSNSDSFKRPLLDTSKSEVLSYAKKQNLQWHEDGTNSDKKYLRNYIRHVVLPQFGVHDRAKLVRIIKELRKTGSELDGLTAEMLTENAIDSGLDRFILRNLTDEITRELLIAWWRRNGFYGYESKTLKRAVETIKVNKSGLIVPLKGNLEMLVGRTKLALIQRER